MRWSHPEGHGACLLLSLAAVAIMCADLRSDSCAAPEDRLHAGPAPEIHILRQLCSGSFGAGASRFLTGSHEAIRETVTARGGRNDAVRKGLDALLGGPSLVYMQGCTIGNVRDEVPRLRTFRGQLEHCRGRSEKAGYYLYRIDERATYRLDGVTGFLFFTFIATTAADDGIYGGMRPVEDGPGVFRAVSESDPSPAR